MDESFNGIHSMPDIDVKMMKKYKEKLLYRSLKSTMPIDSSCELNWKLKRWETVCMQKKIILVIQSNLLIKPPL